jgi:hypothetical protein
VQAFAHTDLGGWRSLLGSIRGHHYFERMKIQIKMQDPPQLRSDIPKATACLRAERLGDCWIDVLTSCTFYGVLMNLRRPCVHLLSVLSDSSNCLTQERIVFPLGTALLRGMLNRRRKVLCVATTDRLFSTYTRTAKPRCVPVQTMLATEMGSPTEQRETMCTSLPPPPPEYSPLQTA